MQTHEEQEEIAEGFKLRSNAGFEKICLSVDGMLVWTAQPTAADCEELRVGERQFHCARKEKFAYSAATSDLGVELEHNNMNIIKPGYTMVSDDPWVPRPWMATPIPGQCITSTDNIYNFYHFQVRITIKRAFGIFVR
eukprot:CCRYP_002524-RA/>CCRYP_002524-RA protein AED:0.23 eAED:0.24 QI:0/0/0/1/0/0/2/0/137